jgi:hypothetical protein
MTDQQKDTFCLNYLDIPLVDDIKSMYVFHHHSLISTILNHRCRIFDTFSRNVIRHGGQKQDTTILSHVDWLDIARRWVIAGTKGAISGWHIDGAGFSTYIHIWAGIKIWFIVCKVPGVKLPHSVHSKEGDFFVCVPLILAEGDDL